MSPVTCRSTSCNWAKSWDQAEMPTSLKPRSSTVAPEAIRERIAGDVIEESSDTFPTITTAVASGTERLAMLNVVDRSEPARPWRRGARIPRS